jgi:hypothetical protein
LTPFSRRAECPVDEEEKAWVEKSMLWLMKQFGRETLYEIDVVLPEREYFPDPFSKTQAAMEKLLTRICGYMRVDPRRVELDLPSLSGEPPWDDIGRYSGRSEERKFTAGRYSGVDQASGKARITIHMDETTEPVGLVATIAHELGHVRLLGERRLTGEEPDHEPLTDLTAIFFGFGIFIANAAFRFSQWQSSTHYGWTTSRLGYLNQPMYGYALACFAWLRGEYKPGWAKYLEPNPRGYFKDGQNYLDKTRDTRLPVHPEWGEN